MKDDYEKIEKVMETLRRSRPLFLKSDEMSENVIRQVQKEKEKISPSDILYDMLFGWVYIGWFRRIMVTAAAIIILLFGFQQALILKRINSLSADRYIEAGALNTGYNVVLPSAVNKYKIFGRKPSAGEIDVSERELEKFINSLNELQVRYRDIFELIKNDPELKKYVEERLYRPEISKPNK